MEQTNLAKVGLFVGAMVLAALIGWVAGPVAAVLMALAIWGLSWAVRFIWK